MKKILNDFLIFKTIHVEQVTIMVEHTESLIVFMPKMWVFTIMMNT